MSEVISEGGDPVEEQVAPEGAVAEGEATEATPVAEAPAVDQTELQAELEYVRSQNNELYSMLQQFANQPGAQSAEQSAQQAGYDISSITDEYGNIDPQKWAAYQQQSEQRIVGRIGEMLQPLQQTFASQQEAQVIAEGEQRLNDILANDVAQNGEFATDPDADARARNLVQTLASQLFPDNAQRYGNGPRAAEISMTQAAAEVRNLLRSVGGAAVSQNQNQLATLAGAHGEPGAHGAGVEAPVIRMGETSAARFGIQPNG